MSTQNSTNLKITNNADGYDITGGTTARKLTLTGADITLTGAGTNTYTYPATTDTLVGRVSTDTLTNKTLTSPKINENVAVTSTSTELNYVDGVTSAIQTQIDSKQSTLTNSAGLLDALNDETGTGVAVFNISPTLVTPILGTPTSGTLTNCTGLPTAGLADNAVTFAKMAHGTDGNLITYDATGAPAAVATGTATHVLTSNGAGAAPTFQAASGGGGDVGGLYGINVETLAAGKTLTADTDKIYQYLDEGGANRIITLDTASASAGDRFVVRHNGVYGDTHYLQVKQSATTLDYIYAGAIKEFIFDGTNWTSGENGSGENDSKKFNVAIGYKAKGYDNGTAVGYATEGNNEGVAIGYISEGYNSGVAIGYGTDGYDFGVAIGRNADGASYGTALGYETSTNSKKYSVAFGYNTRLSRTSEIAHCIDGSYTQDYNMSSAGWAIQTANATPVEMFLGEEANQRFVINPESVVSFTIRIAARDNVANEVASYKIEGLIKRDGADNTVLSWSSKTVEYEDDASWDVAVTADDTNEALIITVTGDATNPVRWAGRIDEVETQF